MFELQLLVVYLRDVKKMGVKERREFITSFCEKYYPAFHPRADYKVIEDTLKHAAKRDNHLIEVNSVTVYKSELEEVERLSEDENERKAMVTLLVRKKIDRAAYACRNPDGEYKSYMSYPFNMKSFKRIKKEGHMDKTVDIFFSVMHGLDEKGLIEFMPRGNLWLHFMEGMVEGGEVAFEVTLNGFDCAGLYYERYKGNKRVGICPECGAAYYKNANNQKYCKMHAPGQRGDGVGEHIAICQECGEAYWISNNNHHPLPICGLCREQNNR